MKVSDFISLSSIVATTLVKPKNNNPNRSEPVSINEELARTQIDSKSMG